MVTSTSTATSTPEPTATPSVTPGFTVTPTPVGTAVVDVQPEAGATVAFANQDNLTTTIEVPPNAVTTPIQLVYTDLPAPDGGSGNLQLAGRYFRLTAYQAGAPLDNFTFQIPIRMVIEYREADLGDSAEEELELRYYDTATAEWRTDGIVVEQRDLVRNLIAVSIAHLTDFALVGATPRIFLPVVAR